MVAVHATMRGQSLVWLNRSNTQSIAGRVLLDAGLDVRVLRRPEVVLSLNATNLGDVQTRDLDAYPLPGRAYLATLTVRLDLPRTPPFHPAVRLHRGNTMTPSFRAALSALLLAFVALLPACLSSSEVECVSGTVRCGDTCVATQTDNSNCGSCGSACSGGNVCVAAACVCPVGQGVCNGICTAVATDPNNCGSCGLKCGSGQACNQGVCQDCSSGGCQTALLAGCIARPGGFLQPIKDAPGGLMLGSPVNPPVATFPDALGFLGTALLYSDHDSSTLLEIPVGALGTASSERPSLVNDTTGSKAFTSQIDVEVADGGTRVYVMATGVNALRIFGGPSPAQAGTVLDGGAGALGLQDLGGAAFDPGTFPEPFGKIGNDIFVPLNQTGKVLRVDVSNPASATVKDTYDLQPLVAGLPGGGTAPDGGPFSPSPTQAIARNGYVYMAANVLRFFEDFSGSDYGPPLVVRIDPTKSGQAAFSAVQALGGTRHLPECGVARRPSAGLCGPADAGELRRRPDLRQLVQRRHGGAHLALASQRQRPADRQLGPDQHRWREAAERGARRGPEHQRLRRRRDGEPSLVLDYGTNPFVERPGYVDAGVPPPICPDFINDLVVSPAP